MKIIYPSQNENNPRAVNHREAQQKRREPMKVGHKAVTIIDPKCGDPYEITLSDLEKYKQEYIEQGVKILVRGKPTALQAELIKC